MRNVLSSAAGALLLGAISVSAHATLIGVTGPASLLGTAPAIIAAPTDILDDIVTNSGMQGFDEAQGVVTTVAYGIDGGGVIAVGSRVDSHMIFLNSDGTVMLTHFGVTWTFDGLIIGVMSDSGGALEAASTLELGNPATNYTATFVGSGPAAPFPARGLEGNNGTGLGGDGYLVSGNTIRVGMFVTEPGDWIRVVTARVPEPTAVALVGLGLAGLGFAKRRQKRTA